MFCVKEKKRDLVKKALISTYIGKRTEWVKKALNTMYIGKKRLTKKSAIYNACGKRVKMRQLLYIHSKKETE